MRFFLTGLAFAGALTLLVAFVWAWVHSTTDTRTAKKKSPVDKIFLGKEREVYLGYDAVIDTIKVLLAEDKSRLLFTPEEQAELREHVARFARIQDT